ncbi:MAG: hypothetical protein EBS21_11855, partial [Sphingomonadaceae bacterium]|nr:hypothetical protein [Sphingomonadaceae bacterium]
MRKSIFWAPIFLMGLGSAQMVAGQMAPSAEKKEVAPAAAQSPTPAPNRSVTKHVGTFNGQK